jgi:hypothetical protein
MANKYLGQPYVSLTVSPKNFVPGSAVPPEIHPIHQGGQP